jgi:FKBP-type peptidyl-prolyl cis-trans isomerase FkpA
VWCQRTNGSWKNMKDDEQTAPIINLFGHIDSVWQRQADMQVISETIATGKIDVKENAGGVYYKMLKEGTGRQVSVTDTVVAFYKGYLFNNGLVFDQTSDKPATFPLKRLIKGWQVGVPLCKVGGKIKLVIPSDLGYSIRTRAAKIPPNSILVFEIEVVDTKPPL